MYKDYYHLKSEPFSTHPNTETFFISHTHKEAWYYLLFGIDTQEPFVVLTGEYGMGKTLLCLRLIKVLKEKGLPRVEYIPTPNEGYGGIMRRMAISLEISPIPEDEEILQDMIYERFRTDTTRSRFYLIIDDAHELDVNVLAKLKHLSTFNHDEFFPVIIFFIGHPSFLQDLKTPALSSLNQRIKRRYHLARFSLEDTKNYINFRMMKSGATGIPAFSDETIQKIFAYSGGIPRLINNICDTCLLIGASRQLITIPPSVVDDARNLVEGSLSAVTKEARPDAAVREVVKEPPKSLPTFSEDLPTGDDARPVAVFTSAEEDEYQPETGRANVSPSSKKIRKIVFSAVVFLLLFLAALWLYRYSVSDERTASFLNAISPGAPPTAPAPAEKNHLEIPTLKEEQTVAPPVSASPPAAVADTVKSSVGEAISKQPTTGDSPALVAGGTSSAVTQEQAAFHPFSLRYASYQTLEKAYQEIAEIKQLGLFPYLVKTDLGDMGVWWRIYIGFYATEDEAKKVKNTFKLGSAIIEKTEYACQVGEFTHETDMVNQFEKLRQAGYFPYIVQKGKSVFRIYIGAYERRAEAEILQQELHKKGIKTQVAKR